jgi:hypothetical protein
MRVILVFFSMKFKTAPESPLANNGISWRSLSSASRTDAGADLRHVAATTAVAVIRRDFAELQIEDQLAQMRDSFGLQQIGVAHNLIVPVWSVT